MTATRHRGHLTDLCIEDLRDMPAGRLAAVETRVHEQLARLCGGRRLHRDERQRRELLQSLLSDISLVWSERA